MTRPVLIASVLALALTACGDAPDAVDRASEPELPRAAPTEASQADAQADPDDAALSLGVEDGVMIEVARLVPEDEACLLMMNVANGTDETVTAGLFAFDVTGNGQSAGANMFPQTAEPGEIVTAQIILPGADCADAQTIEGGQVNCRIVETGESCVDALELRDGDIDFSLND
ncbi:MAG: hypothetical protein AAF311_12170 [Pseudomonadota bacterium]